MSTTAGPKKRVSMTTIEKRILYGILALIVGAALASAFTHMHDWTIAAVDAVLIEIGSVKRTPHWIGWANAVISELLPVAAFLLIRDRQRQKRSVTVPVWIFIGAGAVSLAAQLSATGVKFPGAAQFLVCLPALATIILSKVIFSDLGYAAEVAEREAAEAERKAELSAERERRAAELAAELEAKREREAAELAAELKRAEVAQAAELRQAEARIAAEAELQRVRAEAERDTERARIEAEALAARARVEAAERQAEREAAERRQRREDEARERAALDAARIAAEAEAERQRLAAEAEAAERIAAAKQAEADAEARKAAAERLATMTANAAAATRSTAGDEDEATAARQRMPRAERAALAEAVLATLSNNVTREVAVSEVATQLGITPRYAREFVPEDWPASRSAEGGSQVPPHRHLTVA